MPRLAAIACVVALGWSPPMLKQAAAQSAISQGIADQAVSAALNPPDAATDRATRRRAARLINTIRTRLDNCDAGQSANLPIMATQTVSTQPDKSASDSTRPALRWNPLLGEAARDHALAMANLGFFAHVDPQGRSVGQRVRATGYRWRVVGENLAAGQRSIDEAIQGWLFSRGHCEILLDARFTEFGLARIAHAGRFGQPQSVWALVVAQPASGG